MKTPPSPLPHLEPDAAGIVSWVHLGDLHCYPADLAEGGVRLSELLVNHGVRVVEMGHTHYNELANDGRTLLISPRSTRQVAIGAWPEKGIVGTQLGPNKNGRPW